MIRLAERAVSGLAAALGAAARVVVPLRRAWVHARLASRIQGPVDPSVVVLGSPDVHGTARIQLGTGVLLHRDIYLETQEDGAIWIGDEAVICRGVHIVSHRSVRIGRGAMIGEHTSIRDASRRPAGQGPTAAGPLEARPISIGEHAWLGRGVTVLPGVTIGDGAVVSASSVVAGDVAAGLVVAGIPARPVREGREGWEDREAGGRWEP